MLHPVVLQPMSHNPLDLGMPASVAWHMESVPAARTSSLTSTQRGAIGEAVVAAGLMLASDGRLSPYRPIADDDGVDLLLVDKLSRSIVQLQIKTRTKVDDPRTGTVQFDVRMNTFAEGARGYVLGILLYGAILRKAWLVPLGELRAAARPASNKLVIVASAKDHSKDRFRRFRHDGFESVTRVILDNTVTVAGTHA